MSLEELATISDFVRAIYVGWRLTSDERKLLPYDLNESLTAKYDGRLDNALYEKRRQYSNFLEYPVIYPNKRFYGLNDPDNLLIKSYLRRCQIAEILTGHINASEYDFDLQSYLNGVIDESSHKNLIKMFEETT